MRRPATTARAAAHSAGRSARTGAPSSAACSTTPRARMAASSSRQWYTSLYGGKADTLGRTVLAYLTRGRPREASASACHKDAWVHTLNVNLRDTGTWEQSAAA